MKDYTIQRVDRRFNGYGYFKYIVTPVYRRGDYQWMHTTSRLMFDEWREWCRATFGTAMEREWACGLMYQNKIPAQSWAWDTDRGDKRLYLRGDEELTIFELKF
jgi:hypothetical protein